LLSIAKKEKLVVRKCFVIMPFEESFDGIWKTVIKPTVEEIGDKCLRADDIFAIGSVMDDIICSIQHADYIIADLTKQNPNVYYELGFAHALDKPAILLTSNIASLPFDLRQHRIIKYTDTAAGAAKLRESLNKYLAVV
jgi:hypothetical protein